MINNALTLYQHKALDVTTTLDVIEDQVTFVCSIFEKDRRKGDDLRQPTKVKYNSLHNIAISIGNLIVWCQQDGSLDAPTAIALICEYNLTLLSCFEYHPQERK